MWPRVLSDKHWGVARSLSLFHWDLFYRLFWVLIVLELKWKLLAQGLVLEIAHAHGQDIFKESTHSLWERKCKRSFEGTYFLEQLSLALVAGYFPQKGKFVCKKVIFSSEEHVYSAYFCWTTQSVVKPERAKMDTVVIIKGEQLLHSSTLACGLMSHYFEWVMQLLSWFLCVPWPPTDPDSGIWLCT